MRRVLTNSNVNGIQNLFWCNFGIGYKKQALGILRIAMPFLDPTMCPEPTGLCPGAPVKKNAARPVVVVEPTTQDNTTQDKSTAQRMLDLHAHAHC